MRAPLDGATILITGASSGIGMAFAGQLAPRARALVLVARRRNRLEALRDECLGQNAQLQVHIHECDLTDRRAVDTMLERVAHECDPVDILINNAGFGMTGLYEHADWNTVESMIELNIRALAYLTHRLLPPMVERQRGGILNVSSGWGLQFAPGFAAYAGTKHFVTGFTECLRLEVKGRGVVVTQVCPGPVRTEFHAVAGVPDDLSPDFTQLSPQACARAALRGFERGRAMVTPGFLITSLLALGGATPRFIRRFALSPLNQRMKRLAAETESRR
jgi:short-subunit dehydrogenase